MPPPNMRSTPPTEAEVGMSQYMNPEAPGFAGRYKEKWQDFHVHEVDLNGNIMHLSELITPGLIASEARDAAEDRRRALDQLGPSFNFSAESADEIKESFGEGATAELLAFLRKQRGAKRRRKTANAPAASSGAAASDAAAAGSGDGSTDAAADAASAADSTAAPTPTTTATTPMEADGKENQEDNDDADEPGGEASSSTAPPAFVDFDSDALGDGSKEARKKAHQVVLKHFGQVLNTETLEGDGGKRTIRIWMKDAEKDAKSSTLMRDQRAQENQGGGKAKGSKGKGGKGKKGKGKGKKGKDQSGGGGGGGEFGTLRREGWPKTRPDYLYFRLFKENCDTSEAVNSIARCLGRSSKQFTFAGTKDRRGITVQQICARRVPIDHIRRALVSRQWDRRLRISDLEYRAERLRLGMLSGNLFKIALRDVSVAATEPVEGKPGSRIDLAFKSMQERGFLNYFGLQRFGTRKIRTHTIGAKLISSQWQDAVLMIVGDEDPNSTGEPSAKRQKCDGSSTEVETDPIPHYLEIGDTKAALAALPRSEYVARCLLGALDRGLNFCEALQKLPHQALSLYAHAAQSVVFNEVLSRRIAQFGREAVEGDFVLAPGSSANSSGFGDAPDEVLAPLDDDVPDDEDVEDEEVSWGPPKVRPLSAEEAKTTSLAEIVLPLPGSQVDYPAYLRAIYEDVAKEKLGLKLEDFNVSGLLSLPGSYRSVLVVPQDLEWRTLHPPESRQSTLIPSDVAALMAARDSATKTTTTTTGGEGGEGAGEGEGEGGEAKAAAPGAAAPGTVAKGKTDVKGLPSVTMTCRLPASAYVTVMLREVMKTTP